MSSTSESERLRAIIETVIDGIITIDDSGCIETVNPAAEKLFGYAPSEMIGQNVCMLMPEPYRSEHSGYITNFLRSGDAKVIGKGRELIGRRKDGSSFAMELAVNEMHIGDLTKFTGIVRDISQRKFAERELRSGEAKLRAVFDTVLDSIITIDKKGIIETINNATEALFGYNGSELIGNNIKILMPGPFHKEHDSYLTNYLTSGIKKVIGKGREVIGRRKDGSTFPMELAVNEMIVDGEIKFTGVLRDITERKHAEKLRQDFIATVSHELRTPLTSIKGSLGLLNSDKILNDKTTLRNLLSIAESNTSRLLYLINDLLDFQKIQAGKMQYHFEEFDLLTLMSETVDECQHYGKHQNVTVKITQISVNHPLIGDKFRLAQVLANLLSNAIKFSHKNGQVEIAAIEQNEYIQISIKDYGKGISEEYKERIFSEFSQGDHSNTREIPGTGLGLCISKAIVESHHGTIYFESEPDKGTTFYVKLLKIDFRSVSNSQF